MVGSSGGEAADVVADAPAVQVPHTARAHLTHAVLQRIAEQAAVPVLHLKGAALLPGIRPAGRPSTDADILVAPGALGRLQAALSGRGWERLTALESGSAFGHATTWFHPDWGYADLHARWPGPTVPDREVFAVLSEDSLDHPIAHVPCRVPGRTGQILVLLLHAARSAGSDDVEHAWTRQSEEQRAAVRALAERLGAQVPLAFALGDSEGHRDDDAYDLWRYYRQGGTRLEEWRARFRAAGSPTERLRVVRQAVRLNRDHLRLKLGHEPTRAELALAHVDRIRTVGREVAKELRRHLSRRRGRSAP